jgi:hypothetical protein
MNLLALPITSASEPVLCLAGTEPAPEPLLGSDERTEIGERLESLLWGLHAAGNLRARPVDTSPPPRLQVHLPVPGSEEALAEVWQVEGVYELALTYGPWQRMTVLRRGPGGYLEALYRAHFCSRAEQERQAKQQLLRGFNHLMFAQTWGITHH